jgi:cytochrome c-type biogenesis protein CcmH/NrfG
MVQRLTCTARLLAVALLLAVAACTAPQPSSRYPAPAPYPPQTGTAPGPIVGVPSAGNAPAEPSAPKPQASATLALQSESQRAAASGDLPRAIQILERAIRISPDSAELWIELARLHLQEGDAAQAEQFARKALLFTGTRYDLEQQAWVIIADARKANG